MNYPLIHGIHYLRRKCIRSYEYCTQILPLISDAMEKVNKLEQAISEASGVRGLISNIQEYNNCIRRLDITDPEGKAMFVYYNGLINECNSKIGEIRENVRLILS